MKVFAKEYTYSVSPGLKKQPINQWCEVEKEVETQSSSQNYVICSGKYKGFYLWREEFLTVQEIRKNKINKIYESIR